MDQMTLTFVGGGGKMLDKVIVESNKESARIVTATILIIRRWRRSKT